MVRAKFKCTSVQTFPPSSESVNVQITMAPVIAGPGHPNADWSKATPTGELKMTVTNPGAADYFVAGQDYMMTFERA